MNMAQFLTGLSSWNSNVKTYNDRRFTEPFGAWVIYLHQHATNRLAVHARHRLGDTDTKYLIYLCEDGGKQGKRTHANRLRTATIS